MNNNKMNFKKKTLYPKTKRIGAEEKIVITEKLDGSNLGIFRSNKGLLIAQRNNIFNWWPGIEVTKDDTNKMYKGLLKWLETYGEQLINNISISSGFFGEWIGMGKINYKRLDKQFYIFAKANLNDEEDDIKNLYYDRSLFIYPFIDQTIPEFIGVVPLVAKLNEVPTVADLNKMYTQYVLQMNDYTFTGSDEFFEQEIVNGVKHVLIDLQVMPEKVEGFIIVRGNDITKYVRLKGGQLTEHKLPK